MIDAHPCLVHGNMERIRTPTVMWRERIFSTEVLFTWPVTLKEGCCSFFFWAACFKPRRTELDRACFSKTVFSAAEQVRYSCLVNYQEKTRFHPRTSRRAQVMLDFMTQSSSHQLQPRSFDVLSFFFSLVTAFKQPGSSFLVRPRALECLGSYWRASFSLSLGWFKNLL